MATTPKKQQGFSVIMAIFIIVVLGALAAAMLSFLAAGSESVAREIVSARALMAAESGAQRKLNEVFPPAGGTVLAGVCVDGPADNWDFGSNGLEGCSNTLASVTCRSVNVRGVNYIYIRSVGQCGPLADQAVRIVEVQARDGF
ncbi:pilus assembly FimT family protein [Oceanicoccus sagamiensis]|uniref:MSHA biogenesis protein MshP n=1 Tax=Oceanicoccus sagamiensis TaxID=716816 RepID=A0A1X9NHW8_9GAMM|nr:hypothetical protein [Oceanicoccus sagamiensis]ARN73583.1 hypothetical protein BST96_05285 [Oceanicoccus sagamiensis]